MDDNNSVLDKGKQRIDHFVLILIGIINIPVLMGFVFIIRGVFSIWRDSSFAYQVCLPSKSISD